MIAALLAAALAVSAAPVADAGADCPKPRLWTPRYPAELARANKQGEVLVGARIDECGRVRETRVDKSSGYDAFDRSAREAVAIYVLNASQRARAKDGWVQLPIRFGGIRTIDHIRKIPWPSSHRRPTYVADEQPLPFASIADFKAAQVQDTEGVMQPPYRAVRDTEGRSYSTSMRPDRRDPSVFWFMYTIHSPRPSSGTMPSAPAETAAIARYRLAKEEGKPVVRLGILCERPEEECAKLRDFLFQGLPFAKPRRR